MNANEPRQWVCFKRYTTKDVKQKNRLEIVVQPFTGTKPDGFYHEVITANNKLTARSAYAQILKKPKVITKPKQA